MAKAKKLPKGVTRTSNGKYRASVTKHGVRNWSPPFVTPEEADAWAEEVRTESASSQRVWGNDKVRELLSVVAFEDLMGFVGEGGVIDTSPDSEFDIWRRAARECRVDLKPASEFFSWLNEVVLSADDSWRATESPDVFVRELRKLEALGIADRLGDVNQVLRLASAARRTVTLEEVAAEILGSKTNAEA